MTVQQPGQVEGVAWRRSLAIAAACAAVGVVVHVTSRFLPVPLAMVGLGVGLMGASFMLAWAADAGEAVFSGGLVLAVIAIVTVLPEFVIEIRFAFIQAAELVTANLTGATRLLLTGAATLPLLLVALARRRGEAIAPVRLSTHRRLELGILLVCAVFAVQITIRGSLSVFDGVLLIALYVLYARRVQGTPDEEPAVVGVAAGLLSLPAPRRRPAIISLIVVAGAVVLLIANPFADALLHTGTALGIDPYLLIQTVVPAATEAPEFVVVAILVVNHRPAQGLALFLASSVSQWTLGLGALPLAYLAGGGGLAMPLAPREQLELALTIAVTLFVVAALATLQPERVDAMLMAGAFLAQLLYPAPLVRLAAAFVLLVFAIDLLCSRRREIPALLRAVWWRRRSSG
jgi:cation:H+ antiporter